MYICTRHFPARNRTRRISSADHREQIRYIRSSFRVVDINSVRKREKEREQNERKKYLSSTDDWTKTAAKRKKTTTGLGFRSSRNGSAIPLFGASLEISRYAYSRRKDEADIVAVSSRRFARCFAYRVSRVCVHATRTYLFFSPVHRVNGDSS